MGVNMIDLCKLTEIRNGRLEFNRTKTGHLYQEYFEKSEFEDIWNIHNIFYEEE